MHNQQQNKLHPNSDWVQKASYTISSQSIILRASTDIVSCFTNKISIIRQVNSIITWDKGFIQTNLVGRYLDEDGPFVFAIMTKKDTKVRTPSHSHFHVCGLYNLILHMPLRMYIYGPARGAGKPLLLTSPPPVGPKALLMSAPPMH